MNTDAEDVCIQEKTNKQKNNLLLVLFFKPTNMA